MKSIIDVRSNPYYSQSEVGEKFKLNAHLEIILIHSAGKVYKVKNKQLVAESAFEETRYLVSPEMLQELITGLQLHQQKLNGIRNNAEELNALIKKVSNPAKV